LNIQVPLNTELVGRTLEFSVTDKDGEIAKCKMKVEVVDG